MNNKLTKLTAIDTFAARVGARIIATVVAAAGRIVGTVRAHAIAVESARLRGECALAACSTFAARTRLVAGEAEVVGAERC